MQGLGARYTLSPETETKMTNPTAAMLVIGDEILSGRTRDSNTHHLAGELTARGIRLICAAVPSR